MKLLNILNVIASSGTPGRSNLLQFFIWGLLRSFLARNDGRLLFSFLLLLLFQPSFATQIDISAKLDSSEILIGDWVTLKIEINHDKNIKVFWPSLEKSLPANEEREIEILSSTGTDTVPFNTDFIKESRTITLTVFDSGYYVILPLQFKYQLENDDSFYTLESEPLLLTVRTIEVDTSQPVKPIKEPLNLPFQLSEIKYYLIGGGVLLALLAALFFYLKMRKKKPVMVKKIRVVRPPHEIALEKLKNLEEEKLWQKGEIKQYYSSITDIVREYVELRFNFLALESTTDEIAEKMKSVAVEKDLKDSLQELLQHSDLVKFAKANPLPDEHARYLNIAYDFIRRTKRDIPAETIEEFEEQA